jgi:2,4-dienoyl-CoA reductase-like NADH-dependent reductase (Old Yellow Enzyme family)
MTRALFTPMQLAGLELPNRIVVSPMCQYAAVDGMAQPWHWMHLGGFAVSGAGLVVLEATAVEAVGRISHHCLGLYNEAQEEALSRLVSDMKSFAPDVPVGVQLAHAGRKAAGYDRCSPRRDQPLTKEDGAWDVVGPSPVSYNAKAGWQTPHELDEAGLVRVRQAFVDSARRADRCSFDLIEFHGAHGYLLHTFVSPLTNFRTDRYGGDAVNRMRFPLEVVEAVRGVWPADKPLGMRITGDDWHDGGLTITDAVAYARALHAAGLDFVTLSAGNIVPGAKYPPVAPSYMVDFAERVRAEAGIPTVAVGMIVDPWQAEEIVASGKADLVALARAFLDDPRWGWHAAAALGVDIPYPDRYNRVRPAVWPGYRLAHPGSG